jgi:HlyD family secretion protein
MTQPNRLVPLSDALTDHSIEGIGILTAEPRRALRAFVYAMVAFVVIAVAWSFIGHADVIVAEQGTLEPASEVRRFYAPVDGELVNLYVADGQPVTKGDVLARLNSRGAVEAAGNAMQAQLKLENAEREWREFPEKKVLLEQKAAVLRQAMELEERQYQKRVAIGTSKLVEEQKAQMAQARTSVEEAERARDAAQLEEEKFNRVYSANNGGVSLLQVEGKKNARQAAENTYRLAQSKLNELAARQSEELVQAQAQLESSGEQLKKIRLDYESASNELATAEEQLRLQLDTARAEADTASRIRFENIDADNFLQIVAPTSGIVTDLTSTQPGDKVQANSPLGGIVASNARYVVKVEIGEQDRAFLREGQSVKLKFNAFPYQRYGVIDGTLDYISPTTRASSQTKQPVYEGRVSLERDHYQVGDTKYSLRYGMTATVEIVVRRRRLVDLMLDPFRPIAG